MAVHPVTLAVVTGAHGVTGEVRLKLFTDSVDNLRVHPTFNDGALTVKTIRPAPHGAVARFAEVADRTAAEKLRGTVLTVARDALPPVGPGEYYHADLLGLSCRTPAGDVLGTCIAVENFGASDVLEIERPDGKTFMVPMIAEAVPSWSPDGIVIEEAFAAS